MHKTKLRIHTGASGDAPAGTLAALDAQKLQKDAAEASVKPPPETPYSFVFVFDPLRRCENSSRDASAKEAPNKTPKHASQWGPWPSKSEHFAKDILKKSTMHA